ncbi:Response regulator receiver domain-containing protein [Paraburkholderia steynii]|uniref:Response regulator receiver domain-containing protein n=1 Tax=Paraburkholderia steynii TaxID=1245441 RepID=A0A7Z7BDN8_9BURK|nr:response regulator [Paraburkholderia steynii]SDI91524.1 Response regulator receiver domain-containing protein [Paraburkholderia steynii]
MATILLVDDDVKILRPLRVILEAEGYDVLTAEDGEAAVAVTAFGRPDLIVTDWMMPGVDGAELCRRVRADPATAGIPIVVLTAASGPYPVEAPWNVLLRKPTPIARLLDVIAILLEARGLRPLHAHAR